MQLDNILKTIIQGSNTLPLSSAEATQLSDAAHWQFDWFTEIIKH